MSKTNNTLKSTKKQYSHLSRDQRCQIEALVHQKDENGRRLYTNVYIAEYIGVSPSTISRELRKRIKSKIMIRTGKRKNKPYNANDADNDYRYKRKLSRAKYKLEKYPKMAKFIEDKILIDKWAPDAIIGYMKIHHYFERDGFCKISTPTVYNAIRNGVLKVRIEDTRRMKENPKYEYHKKKELPSSKQAYSIDLREEEINNRSVFGHFELDTVLSKKSGSHECLLTLTERKTRFEIIFKLQSKTSDAVIKKMNMLKSFLKKHINKLIKSLTTDNGSEFSEFLKIIENTKVKIYFCHPYCSGEKGTNERHNGMIRFFIPKGSLIEEFSFDEINKIANWMNNYPRKILGYKTPLEALLEEFDDKAIINKIYKIQEKVNHL